jgi:hypothetical protein
MASDITWKMKGMYTKSCNCAYGCPCDFWDRPTKGFCTGMLGMHIKEGHFGKTPLSGLSFAAVYNFPGALHEGNGSLQPYVDERANADQRNALLTIMSGKAGNPWFEVVSSLLTTIHPPLFVPIHFEMDIKKLTAKVHIPGHLETVVEPIKNIATGGTHRIQVVLPEGMEYKMAETAAAVVNRAMGKIPYDFPNGHSSLAEVEHTQTGIV